MIYLLSTEKDTGSNDALYNLFETHTESTLEVNESYLTDIIGILKLKVKNVGLDGTNIQIKEWPHSLEYAHNNYGAKNSRYILLAQIDKDKFKITALNGFVSYIDTQSLRAKITADKVLNCTHTKNLDTYTIKKDIEFEKLIAQKYEVFRAKSMILGMDTSFEYKIENAEVKLTNYTGQSELVILPNFISTIVNAAFSYKGIEEIRLNENLRYIGNRALQGNNLKQIIIPNSVKLIHRTAFIDNKKSFYDGDEFEATKIKILGKDTIIL